MLYEVKITYTKKFLKGGGTSPPLDPPLNHACIHFLEILHVCMPKGIFCTSLHEGGRWHQALAGYATAVQ